MTKAYRIAVIIGSLRKESLNRKFARALMQLAPEDMLFRESAIGDMPLYTEEEENNPPAPVIRLKQEISESDGVLFVTPEYNRSIPGLLKNAIDQASRPYGRSSFSGKPAGIAGVSPGAAGTAMAQQHLRNVLAFLDMPTLGQPELFIQAKEGLFDPEGNFGEASRPFLQGWMDRYSSWVRHHSH
ncbi:MAG: NAD(P)H-dependent oxidoreductase [Chlorobiaceae bacterium]|nr:NAD(P)H-dependent oxidoreductase [Chlorobiaceae bacterium]